MNKKGEISLLEKYFTPKNLALTAGLLASVYGFYHLYSQNTKKHTSTITTSISRNLLPISYEDVKKWNSLLSNVKYEICLLLENQPTFQGSSKILFDLKEIPKENLFLMLQCQQILSFKANGKDLLKEKGLIRNQKIYIPSNTLKLNANVIEIVYENEYYNDGSGLTLHIDYDGLPYVYSNNEPYSAHTIFPCFDNFEIRADFKLRIFCERDWVAISNEKIEKISFKQEFQSSTLYQQFTPKSPEESLQLVEFVQVKGIMTYIFTVACGHFCQVHSPKPYGNIESTFYCKKSLVTKLEDQKQEIADLICYGLSFFESYFQIEYPFRKHDMIYLPEFCSYAMECPGAILFCDEEFLFREKPSYSQRVRRAYITLHEISHMWFGNIINIKWIDELWLKESFASFFGYFAMTSPELNRLISDGWCDIELYKEMGMQWDHFKSLRHPLVRQKLADNNSASFEYDDVNYCKGSGVLKVLWARLGNEIFKEFIQSYLKANAYQSVDNVKFLDALRNIQAKHNLPNLNLDDFVKNWLETEGTDTLETILSEGEDGQIESLKFKITRDPVNSQRDHFFKIFLIYADKVTEIQTVYLEGDDSLEVNFKKENDLKAVILNFEGLDFVRVKMDHKTIDYCINNYQQIRKIDPKLETYFWRHLTNMTENKHFPADKLLTLVKQEIDQEYTNNKVIHGRLIMRSEKCFEFVDTNCLEQFKNYMADKVFEALQFPSLDGKFQKHLSRLSDNAYDLQQYQFVLENVIKNLQKEDQNFRFYLDLGTSLVKNLLKTSFSQNLDSLIDEFFGLVKSRCYEDTLRLFEAYQKLKKYQNISTPNQLLDTLLDQEILQMKPRQKALFWTLFNQRFSKHTSSVEYREAFFNRATSIFQDFYRLDAFSIFENLFPNFDSDSDALQYLQKCRDKFKNNELVLHFILKKLDHLQYIST